MAGLSWKGDPAKTRRAAFDRLQTACADADSAQAELAKAEKDFGEALRLQQRVVDELREKASEATSRRDYALVELLKGVPGQCAQDSAHNAKRYLPVPGTTAHAALSAPAEGVEENPLG